MTDCIFCRIAAGAIPADIVYQDDDVVAFRDIHPVAPVHLLIVPRKHVANLLELAGHPDGVSLAQAVLRAVPRVAAAAGVDQTGFRGRYFVLKGHLSPLDGLGPEAIGVPELLERIAAGRFAEVILATNPTVEGEATAHYIAQLLAPKAMLVSRIAHGVPLGGELELVDGGTLAHALAGRKPIGL